MSRILEFAPDNEQDVIERIAMQLHKTIDERFPDAPPSPKRFSQTVFSNEDTVAERPRKSQKPAAVPKPPVNKPAESNVEQFEYSDMNQLEPQKNQSVIRKFLYLILLIVVFATLAALWANNLLN